MMRRGILGAVLAAFTIAACGGGGDAAPPTAPPPPPAAPTVSLSASAIEVRGLGDSVAISATATPAGATLTWSTSSPSVATVSARGGGAMIVGVGGGSTTLTVEVSSGNQRASTTAAVTVIPIVRSVRLDSVNAPLLVGRTRQLRAVVQADAGASDSVRWISRTPLRATVSAAGLVTGVSSGPSVIVSESVADASRRDSVTVQVAAPAVRAITITPSQDTLFVGAFRTFTAGVTADSGLSTAVTWSSSAPSVASVSATGRVTALAPGNANIVVRSVADTTRVAQATVQVRMPVVRQLRLVGTMQLLAGSQAQYTTEVVADPGVSTAVTWTTSQPGVANVDSSGRVTAIGAGVTRITVRSVATPAVADSALLTVSGPPRFAAWEMQQLGVIGGQLEASWTTDLQSLNAEEFLVTYGSGGSTARTFFKRDSLYLVAPGPGLPTSVYDFSMASDGAVVGWNQQPSRVAYRSQGSLFAPLPPLPDGALLIDSPTALPNGRIGAMGRAAGFDRAYIWTGTQWQERFRIAPLIQNSIYSHAAFFSETDILYYEPKTTGNPRDHRLLRWRGGVSLEALPQIVVEGSFFFVPQFFGRSGDDFYALVELSPLLRHFSGGAWRELTLGLAADERLEDMAICPDYAVIGTQKDRVIKIDGTVGVVLGAAEAPSALSWTLSCAPDGTLRRTGDHGYVGRWNGTRWITELRAPATTAVRAISPTLAYAGSADGVIRRWNGVTWNEVFRPAPGVDIGAIASIVAWPDGRAVATARGRTGTHTQWRLTTGGGAWSATSLNVPGVSALWGLRADEVWGVNLVNGNILRSRNGGAFEVMRSDQRYVAVGGRAGGHMIAIAASLETWRWTGTTWEMVAPKVPQVVVSGSAVPAIWSETDAWISAVVRLNDYPNTIFRFNGSSWQPVDMGPLGGASSMMITHALFTPGPGEVYALHGGVGATLTSLYHRIDGAWTNTRSLLARWPGSFGVVSDAAPGLALVVEDRSRVLMSRPGLTGAVRLPAPVRKKQ
jgi:uncharacterized protein YjdB